MESSLSEKEAPVQPTNYRLKTKKRKKSIRKQGEEWPFRKNKVTLEGYINDDQGSESGSSVGRTKSLTDEDLEELKGCLDLGFGFSYEEIPELCNTLPALELCYSMSQMRISDDDSLAAAPSSSSSSSSPSRSLANWNFSSPGDHPDEVKARLKYWAQAVACTVRLCN